MASGRCFSHSSMSLRGPFTVVCTPHVLRRASGLISQAALPGFGCVFFELNHVVSICNLQNGEVFHVRNEVVSEASEPQDVFRQILDPRAELRWVVFPCLDTGALNFALNLESLGWLCAFACSRLVYLCYFFTRHSWETGFLQSKWCC